MAAVSGAAFPDEPDGSFSAAELFQAVNRSDFPESSKLLLADAALDPAGNIDRLNNMLHPIAAAFPPHVNSGCRSLNSIAKPAGSAAMRSGS